MLEQIKKEMEREEVRLEYDVLLQKKIAERLPNHTSEIIEILIKDENKDLMRIIHNYVDENPGTKICLEEPEKKEYIDLHLYDNDYQLVTTIGITDNKLDPVLQIVNEKTFKSLENYVADYETAEADTRLSMRDSI